MLALHAVLTVLFVALPLAAAAQTKEDALVLADLQPFITLIETSYAAHKAGGPGAQVVLSVATPAEARNFYIAENAYKLIGTPAEVRANAVGNMGPNARVVSDIAYVDPADVMTASARITGWQGVTGAQRANLVREGTYTAAEALATARANNPAYQAMGGADVVADISAKSAASRFGVFDGAVPGYRAFRSVGEFNATVERGATVLETRIRNQYKRPDYTISPEKYAAVFEEAQKQHLQKFPNPSGRVAIDVFMAAPGQVGFTLPPGFYDEIRDKTDDAVAEGEEVEDGR